jgi:DNA-binding transcriptional LysR family regulator
VSGVVRFAFRATMYGAFLVAARAGLGIAALPGAVGDGLECLLPRAKPDSLPVALVCHPEARRLPHVKAFADHLMRRFAVESGEK